MCLIKNQFRKKHVKSDKDITCYKVVRENYLLGKNVYYSTCRGFEYEVGKRYDDKSVPINELDHLDILNDGVFHSYASRRDVPSDSIKASNDFRRICDDEERYVIFECIIPKGTPYWVSANGSELASKSLKIVKVIDPKDFKV